MTSEQQRDSDHPERTGWQRDIAPVALLTLLPFALYAQALRFWWLMDDAFHLHFLSRFGPIQYSFLPSVQSQLPFRMLTPLLFLSLDLDRHLFGFRPAFFYVHQLLSWSAALVSIYLVLRLWCARRFSLFGCFLVAVAIPSASIAGLLMLRHYVEGLIWALVSLWLFVRSIRTRHGSLSYASAALFLLAALSKEVFVPLPFLLFLIPEGAWRERTRALVPHAVVLGFYLCWRRFMLGVWIGGYGWSVTPADLPGLCAALPMKVLHVCNASPAGWIAAGLLALLILRFFARHIRAVWRLALGLVVLLAPVIPVSKVMEARYALGAAIIIAGVAAIAASDLSQRRPRLALAFMALVSLAALADNRVAWRQITSRSRQMSEEGRFLMTSAPSDLLRDPAVPPAARGELGWMREAVFHAGNGGGGFDDDLFLCSASPDGSHFWQFDPRRRRVIEIPDIARAARAHCSSIRWNAPLEARLSYDDGTISWELGPYHDGVYRLVFAEGRQAFDVPRREGYQVGLRPSVSLRLRYTAPAGWTTYSDQLTMDFKRGKSLFWKRNAR